MDSACEVAETSNHPPFSLHWLLADTLESFLPRPTCVLSARVKMAESFYVLLSWWTKIKKSFSTNSSKISAREEKILN